MASLASTSLQRLKDIWGRLNSLQRWLTIGLGAALVIAVSLSLMLNRTDWVVLVNQADPKDAAAIVARLQELKVPYRPIGDGFTIQVPKTEQYTAKLALAQAGLPKGSSVGMELFDQPQFGATEFDKKVNYLRALQGELERALTRINELEYANVKLALPDRSVFIRDQQPVTAAVLVQARAGSSLSVQQIRGIINFVAGSVQGLMADKVTVVDQTGRLMSNGVIAAGLDAGGMNPEELQQQAVVQRDFEQRVQTLLEPLFGPGNVVARVNLELNRDASRIEIESVGGTTPKKTQTTRESSQGTSANTVPGSAVPAATPPVYQSANGTGSGDTWRTTTSTDYAVSQRKEVTVVAPGSVKRVSVGIVINRGDLSADQIKQIQETVAGATGAERTAISVAAMPFSSALPSNFAATTAPPLLQPNTLVIGLSAAALAMLLAYFVVKRRQVELHMQPLLVDMPAGPGLGTTLDVALGLDPGLPRQGFGPGVLPGTMAGLDGAAGAAEQEGPTILETPQQKLEFVIAAKPTRQIVLENDSVSEELMDHVNDLVDAVPEAAAEFIRNWLRGGA